MIIDNFIPTHVATLFHAHILFVLKSRARKHVQEKAGERLTVGEELSYIQYFIIIIHRTNRIYYEYVMSAGVPGAVTEMKPTEAQPLILKKSIPVISLLAL